MFETIVWATDGSAAADEALPFAKELASGEGRELVVIHCNEILVVKGGAYSLLADEEELELKIRRQVLEARAEGIDARFELVTGAANAAAHMIADAARDAAADVIVIGTRGHGPVSGLLLGAVTQRLLHTTPCPVLAIPTGKHAATREPERVTAAVG
jgi:nucleotide-binding universal stress UspA family protein